MKYSFLPEVIIYLYSYSNLYLNQNHYLNHNLYQYQLSQKEKKGKMRGYVSFDVRKINYPAASSGVLDSLDSGFRRNDELAASGGEYNPKRLKIWKRCIVFL